MYLQALKIKKIDSLKQRNTNKNSDIHMHRCRNFTKTAKWIKHALKLWFFKSDFCFCNGNDYKFCNNNCNLSRLWVRLMQSQNEMLMLQIILNGCMKRLLNFNYI